MLKRVERKRKRREKEEEFGLDDDTKEMMGLNDTDSGESDSGSEQDGSQSESDESDPGISEDQDQDSMCEGEGADEDPPISVEEALKDPIYLISLDPSVRGCVVCKGKLIKNAGMATAHKNAKGHKRHFESFKRLSAGTDPRSNAWNLVRVIQSTLSVQRVESQKPSSRAVKRQAKQAAIREKRKRHKELKAKAMAKKASKKLLGTPPEADLRCSPESESPQEVSRKKRKTETKTSSKIRDVAAKSALRTKTSSVSKKSNLKSRTTSTKKANKPP